MEWEQELNNSSKLVLFRQLKWDGIAREGYLINVTQVKYRASLTKLQSSAHELRIEKGRHRGEELADRVCKWCLREREIHVLEDEYHLFCCPLQNDVRNKYLADVVTQQLTYEQFLILLSAQEGELQNNIAGYVYQAFKKRKSMLEEI